MEYIEFNLEDLEDEREFKYDLSIAMIVKNEEKVLESSLQALSRLRDEVNCEVIITDTGSTDRTVEIAEQYADKVLHFEWCNDFSKARNTGVEASEGKWFMFIDADEVFDKTIIEIARFIKSPERDDYDNATYIVRNVMDDAKKRYNDFRAGRLFNFTKKKRYFVFTIHEAIPAEGARYQIDAIAWHTGYHKDVFDNKRVRNREILEKELAEDPNNIRYMKQIIDISKDEDEKIELATRAIDLCKSQEAKNPDMIFSIYTFLARTYLSKADYEKTVEVSNDFLRIRMKDNKNLPYLEMSWISATASFKLENYEDAFKKFEFYKANYEYLLKNPDNIFCSIGVYTTNKEPVYHQTCLQMVECLQKMKQLDKAKQFMSTLNCYKYKENDEYLIINAYVNKAIALNDRQFFDKVLEFTNRVKLDIYSKEKYPTMLIARMLFDDTAIDFVYKSNKVVFSKICLLAFKSSDTATEIVYNHLINKTKFSKNKEHEYYIDMMRLYLLYIFDELKKKKAKVKQQESEWNFEEIVDNKDEHDQIDDLTKKVNKIFELLIKQNHDYINKTQNVSQLKEQGFDKINKMQAMTIIVWEGLKNKEKNKIEYEQVLKRALPYSDKHIDSVKLAIQLVAD